MNRTGGRDRSPFDPQGAAFDRRAGLSRELCRQVAENAIAMAGVQSGGLILDVGAGTGLVGECLRAAPAGGRYLGLDLSLGMLETFRQRSRGAWLALADANRPWPLGEASVGLIFTSRAIHWLDPEPTVGEIFRVARPAGACLLVGRVERDLDGVRSRMRREMRRRLGRVGLTGRSGKRSQGQIFELCCQRGAEMLPPVTVSRWTRGFSPGQALSGWRGKPGLAGLDLSPAVKGDVLGEVEDWAVEAFGDLDTELPSGESYVLEGVRLTPLP